MKTVDTHAHTFSANDPVVSDARYRPANDALAATYLKHLDQQGFDYGVLIQPSFLGYDNSYMLDSIRQYPDRLKGVAVLPLDVETHTLAELEECGIVGARLNLFGKPVPALQTKPWQRFLRLLGERHWQLELHCPPNYLVQLLPALQKYRGPVVFDHFGRIDPEKGTDDPNYLQVLDWLDPEHHWVKLSGFYRLGEGQTGKHYARQALTMLLDKGMQNQLVWGSDWPHTQHGADMSYERAVMFLQELLPDSLLREKVLTHNPLRLFGFAH